MTAGETKNDVMAGGNGHLFLVGGRHRVLDHVAGRQRVEQESFGAFDRNVAERAAWAAAANAAYCHLISPDKQSVLEADFPLPPGVSLGRQYLAACPAVAPMCCYPDTVLRDAGTDVFLRTDTHLSDRGNMVVARHLARRLLGESCACRLDPLFGHVSQEKPYCGDLGKTLSPAISFVERYLSRSWGARLISNRMVRNEGIVDIWLSPRSITDKRMLIFGDSFGRGLARLLSFLCRETVFLRSRFFHADIAEAISPDIVLTQNAERYLSRVRPDAERPSFWMYPYLGADIVIPTPDAGFGAAMSAILSYPRHPYQVFRKEYQEKAVLF